MRGDLRYDSNGEKWLFCSREFKLRFSLKSSLLSVDHHTRVCCLSGWGAHRGERAEITFPSLHTTGLFLCHLSATRSHRTRGASLLLSSCFYCSAIHSDFFFFFNYTVKAKCRWEDGGSLPMASAQGDFCCRLLSAAVIILWLIKTSQSNIVNVVAESVPVQTLPGAGVYTVAV